MTSVERTVDISKVNGLLWRYRPCLERFEFLLEMQLTVTASGRQDWQRQMADLFEESADRLNSIDLEREVLLGDLTLRELAADVPEPWDAILLEQLVELEAVTNRISSLRQRNATAIESSAEGVTKLIEALLSAGGVERRANTGATYGQNGRTNQGAKRTPTALCCSTDWLDMGIGSLNIAYTGLNAHQRRIDVIGENITNVDTPGYHRQRVDLQSISKEIAGVHSGHGNQAGGVRADTVHRLHNSVLSAHAREQGSKAAGHQVNAETLGQIEQLLGGLEEGGLHGQMVSLFNAFDDLAAAPEDGAIRNVVLQRATGVAQSFTRTAGAIDDLRERVYDEAQEDVRSINLLADQIANLDTEILKASSLNSSPNSLLDKRDQLVKELAEFANVTVNESPNKQVSVSLGGQLIVSAGRSSHVQLGAEADVALGALGYGRYSLQTTTGRELSISTGSLAARLSDLNVTIPDARINIDTAAKDLADQVNALHSSGVGLDASSGLDMFVFDPGQLTVSVLVAGQPDRVAAGKPAAGPLDNTNAREIAELAESPTGPLRNFVNLVGATAAQVATAVGLADAATTAQEAADNLALQGSGVSLDEELADLVSAQRSYEASARLLTSMDEMLQTLIGIGLVGR